MVARFHCHARLIMCFIAPFCRDYFFTAAHMIKDFAYVFLLDYYLINLIFYLNCSDNSKQIMASGPYNYSYIFKYIIIGDMGVGKSCLLHQFTEKKCKT